MKKVVLVSAFVNPFKNNNNRVLSIGRMFQDNGYQVTIITTDFSHMLKKRYPTEQQNPIFDTIFLKVPVYKTSMSINRLYSHLIFSFKVKNILNKMIADCDIIYATTPTTLAPFFARRISKRNKKPFLLDVIDLWPEAISNNKILLKLLIWPWKIISHSNLKAASYVFTASESYEKFIKKLGVKRVKNYYLGIDMTFINKLIVSSKLVLPSKEAKEIWIAYGGNLGYAYDFDVIIDSLIAINNAGFKYKMIFIGGGDMEKYIATKIKNNNINGIITGKLDYKDYLKWLSNCDLAINSFKKETIVAHSYKFNDYLATSCCVLNNLSGETANMVEKYQIGFNFDQYTLDKVLFDLLNEPERISQCKTNSNSLIENVLSKEKIYTEVFKDIQGFILSD